MAKKQDDQMAWKKECPAIDKSVKTLLQIARNLEPKKGLSWVSKGGRAKKRDG